MGKKRFMIGLEGRPEDKISTIHQLSKLAYIVVASASMGVTDPLKIARCVVSNYRDELDTALRELPYSGESRKFLAEQRVRRAEARVDNAEREVMLVANFASRVLVSENPLIREWSKQLPHGRSVKLEDGAPGVYCSACRAIVNWVPCPSCHPGTLYEEIDCSEPDEPPEPTDASPGSQEKIEIMAIRHGAGQKVFHVKDRKLKGIT